MHKLSLSPQWPLWLRIFLLYLLLLLILGYQFGGSDQVELLPYALHLIDPELYSNDFFLSHLVQERVNERLVYAWILHLCGSEDLLPGWCFILHAISSLGLISAWMAVFRHFGFSLNRSFLWVAISMLLLYGINLGGNELYYNYCVASLSAKALCSWAFVCWLRSQFFRCGLILAVSVFIQPVAGLQLWLVFSGAGLLGLMSGALKKDLLKLILAFIIPAGYWLYLLFSGFSKGDLSDAALMEIIRFRLPHHFLPSFYPLRAWCLLLPLFIAALFIWRHKERRIFYFYALSLTGCLVYTVSLSCFDWPGLLASQWFKITIWLKPLSILALALYLRDQGTSWSIPRRAVLTKIAWALLLLACLRPLSATLRDSRDDKAIQIAKEARRLTGKDALFLIPASNSTFKYCSQRGCYIDYKSVLHKKPLLPLWYARIREIYQIDLASAGPAFGNVKQADAHFRSLDDNDLKRFRALGADFVLTFRTGTKLSGQILTQNEDYIIYALPH